jgi:hypothetical protein
MKNLRIEKSISKPMTHPDFDFVKPGEENLFIVAAGGRSGRVFTDYKHYRHYTVGMHHYIRASQDVIDNFIKLESELLRIADSETTRVRGVPTGRLVRAYISAYGSPELL